MVSHGAMAFLEAFLGDVKPIGRRHVLVMVFGFALQRVVNPGAC